MSAEDKDKKVFLLMSAHYQGFMLCQTVSGSQS